MSRVVDNPWIIDSGANNHITQLNLVPLSVPYFITLPNDTGKSHLTGITRVSVAGVVYMLFFPI